MKIPGWYDIIQNPNKSAMDTGLVSRSAITTRVEKYSPWGWFCFTRAGMQMNMHLHFS